MLNEEIETTVETVVESTETKVREDFVGVARDQVDTWAGRDWSSTFDFAVERVIALAQEDGAREDWLVDDLDQWVFGLDGGIATIGSLADGRTCQLRHTAFAQLCERAKAPSRYLRSIPVRYALPALNWGLKNCSEGPAMIRLADGEARAILSKRYGRFDDAVVFPQLRENLAAAGLLESVTARVVATGLTTLVRVGIPGETISIPGTDEIAEIALDFTNGETGNRACVLAPCVYLTRGEIATRRGGVRIRHLGSTDRLVDEFREAVPESLAEARVLRDQVVASVDRAISDIAAEADKLRNMGLSIAEARDVLRKIASSAGAELPHDTAEWEAPLQSVGDVRAFDVFAAIAGLGEGRSVDRRLELEEVAAKYLARVTKK